MWGTWLAAYALIFSKMSMIPHTAYIASLAPPLAALSGAGIVMFWRAYRAGGWRGWALPLAVAVEVAWAVCLWRDYGGFLPWARDLLVVTGAVAVVALVAARISRVIRGRLVTVALGAGVAALLAAPATWAASVLDVAYAGTSLDAAAGPANETSPFAATGMIAMLSDLIGNTTFGGIGTAGAGGGLGSSTSTTLTSAEQKLYDYLSAHRDGASYLMAVSSWSEAAPYIIATGQEVMPMGGFSGSVPSPALAAVKHLVQAGQLKFFLVSDAGTGTGAGLGALGGGGGVAAVTIDAWVRSACTVVVPATDYTSTTATAVASGESLYACARSA
jgi:hypothetical protein